MLRLYENNPHQQILVVDYLIEAVGEIDGDSQNIITEFMQYEIVHGTEHKKLPSS